MRALRFFVLLAIAVHATTGQAPGDAEELCLNARSRPPVVNQEILLANFNYGSLLQSSGGPWAVVDLDDNNDLVGGTSTPMVRCTLGVAHDINVVLLLHCVVV